MTVGSPKVSVIIPVFNDTVRLEQCLEALEKQTYPKDCYEVIVIDNASTADIKTPVSKYAQASYQYEKKPGSYAARNKGLSVATGEMIGFTDSDCLPDSNWIEQGVKALLDNPDCGLVGGAITLFYKDPERLTGIEIYESLIGFPQKKYIEEGHFGATANVFTFRKVIDAVGLFNAELKSGGDSEWGKRVAEAGYPLCYVENVQVAHPARSTYSEYYKKTVRVLSGLPAFRNHQLSLGGIFWRLARGVLVTPVFQLRRVLPQAAEKSRVEKLKLSLAVLFISYVRVFEGARLRIRNRNIS